MVKLSEVYNNTELDKLVSDAMKVCVGEKLLDEDIIKGFKILDAAEIDLFLDKPKQLYLDDDDNLYVIVDNEKIMCPEITSSISKVANWISSYLPAIPFDIVQEGNVRKKLEVEAIYTTAIVSTLLGNDSISEFRDIYDDGKYDFTNLAPVKLDGRTFRSYLNDLKALNSIIINSVISSCNYVISDFKTKKDPVIYGMMTEEERSVCQNINLSRVRIILETDEKIRRLPEDSPKLERLKIIEERNTRIENLYNDPIFSNYAKLYKITLINSKYVTAIRENRINVKCNKLAVEIMNEKNLVNDSEFQIDLIRKLKRTAINLVVRKIKLEEFAKYRLDKENYTLPSRKKI